MKINAKAEMTQRHINLYLFLNKKQRDELLLNKGRVPDGIFHLWVVGK